MDLGYARVEKAQDLDDQLAALTSAGVPIEQIYVDRIPGTIMERPGLQAVLGVACVGDVIVVHTLSRLGRTLHDVTALLEGLSERGVGVRVLTPATTQG